jgi:hypothetical protein
MFQWLPALWSNFRKTQMMFFREPFFYFYVSPAHAAVVTPHDAIIQKTRKYDSIALIAGWQGDRIYPVPSIKQARARSRYRLNNFL